MPMRGQELQTAMREAIELSFDRPTETDARIAMATRAVAHLNSGRIEACLRTLDELEQRGAVGAEADLVRAVALARADRLEPAIGCLRRLLERRPTHVKGRALLAELETPHAPGPAEEGALAQVIEIFERGDVRAAFDATVGLKRERRRLRGSSG